MPTRSAVAAVISAVLVQSCAPSGSPADRDTTPRRSAPAAAEVEATAPPREPDAPGASEHASAAGSNAGLVIEPGGPAASCGPPQLPARPRRVSITPPAGGGTCTITWCAESASGDGDCITTAVVIVDAAERPEARPEAVATTLRIDAAGRVVEHARARSSNHFTYVGGRLSSTRYTDGTVSVVNVYVYDARGHLLRVDGNGPASRIAEVRYEDGCRASSVARLGKVIGYGFDDGGELVRMTVAEGSGDRVIELLHGEPGKAIDRHFDGFVFEYDSTGRLTGTTQWDERYRLEYASAESAKRATTEDGPTGTRIELSGYCPFTLCRGPASVGDTTPRACLDPVEGAIKVETWPHH